MGFLNPLFLVGLLSAAVPLLIHLWSRRQARTVDFSALRFLLEAHRRTVRRFQLEQWLILALRVLALILIVFALARPVLHGGLSFAQAHVQTSAVIVLDNSASMGYRGPDGVPFEAAKRLGVEILRSLRAGDDASLVLMSDRAEVLFEPGTPQRNDVEQAIRSAPLSSRATRVEPAFERAVALLRRSAAPNRELYLISDFTKNGWGAGTLDAEGIRVFFVPVAPQAVSDVGVTSLEVENPLIAAGIPTTFRVTLRNFGQTRAAGISVELSINGEPRRSVTVDIPPGGEARERFTHTFEAAGLYDVRARVEKDRFPADDERAIVVSALGQIEAFTIGHNTTYLALAVNPMALGVPQAVYTLRPTPLSYDALRSQSLDGADVLLLQDPPLGDDRLMGRVRNFVLNGGAAILFLGPSASPSALGRLNWMPVTSQGITTFPTPTKLRPAHLLGGDATTSAQAASRSVFGIFEGDPWTRPSAPNFYQAHRLAAKEGTRTLAALSDGTPAIVETSLQEGRLLVVNTPATGSEWSNLPLSPAFVPLVQQLVFYALTPLSPPDRTLEVGQPYVRPLRTTDPVTVIVTTPDGKRSSVGRSEDGRALMYTKTDTPGVYHLVSGLDSASAQDQFRDAFAVNFPIAESNLTPLSRETAIALAGSPVEWLDERTIGADDFRSSLQSKRLGRELWSEFLLAAVALLLIETVLSNRARREEEPPSTVREASRA